MSQEPLLLQDVLEEEAAAIRPDGDGQGPFSALCISGGGIRSATFALGALQSLADHGLLTQFDYLSSGFARRGDVISQAMSEIGGFAIDQALTAKKTDKA